MNPFTDLLNRIEAKVREDRASIPDELLVLVAVQLKLLKTIYRSMFEYDMRETMMVTSVAEWEEHSYKSTKSILDYFQFINLLNQLGRILKKYGIVIPQYSRISFFRNKVSEHWEEYTKYGITGSLFQAYGDAAVPFTSTIYLPEERKKIKSEIDRVLSNYDLKLEIENPEVGNASNIHSESIYSALENIDPNLTTRRAGEYVIPDELVGLLFKFGFPAPILKVAEYSKELATFLEKELVDWLDK